MQKTTLLLLAALFLLYSCAGQQENQATSANQDIEATPPMLFGMPKDITSIDTTAGWESGEEKLIVTGTIYQPDGKTPAPGILFYYYHTNAEGRYLHKSEIARSLTPNQSGMTHGHLRGWIKTDSNGNYAIYTSKPGSYPSRDEAAHIHYNIKEPDLEEHYYIDDVVFDNDPLLTMDRRSRFQNRGGSGIVKLSQSDGVLKCNRDIILGLNIPDYRQ